MNNKNKKVISLLLVAVFILCFTACGSAAPKSDDSGYADSQAFLKDMAKGIKDRLAAVDDEKHANDTDEQRAAYYEELVGSELKQIEKYENSVFADSLFNTLAHQYISACQMQLTGAKNYRNTDLYSALWDGGRTIRSSLIVYFYKNYNLPISSEEAQSYSPGSQSGSIVISSDNDFESSGERNIEINATKGNNTILNENGLVIKFDGIIEKKSSYLVGLTFDNTTGKTLYITMSNLKFDRVAMSAGNTAVELPDDTNYVVGPHHNFVVSQNDVTNRTINKISFNLEIYSQNWYGDPYATFNISIITNITL